MITECLNELEKNASVAGKIGELGAKVLKLPLGAVLGAAALAYTAPKVIDFAFTAKTMSNTGDSADSLSRLEDTNRQVVEQLQAMAPAATPKPDTYPYV